MKRREELVEAIKKNIKTPLQNIKPILKVNTESFLKLVIIDAIDQNNIENLKTIIKLDLYTLIKTKHDKYLSINNVKSKNAYIYTWDWFNTRFTKQTISIIMHEIESHLILSPGDKNNTLFSNAVGPLGTDKHLVNGEEKESENIPQEIANNEVNLQPEPTETNLETEIWRSLQESISNTGESPIQELKTSSTIDLFGNSIFSNNTIIQSSSLIGGEDDNLSPKKIQRNH